MWLFAVLGLVVIVVIGLVLDVLKATPKFVSDNRGAFGRDGPGLTTAESNLPDYTAAMYLLAVVFGLLYARLRTTPEADPPGGSAAAVPAVPDLPAVPRWDGRRRTATGAHSGRVSP